MKFRPCVPGCFAPATAARPCHGHAAAGLHGYARSRGAAASVLMPRHMSRYPPHVSLRPPVNLRTFQFFFFFKHWTYWYALHTPGLRPRCAGCTGMRAAYTRTASPHRWMRWHALAYARTASAHFLALDVLACASIHQDYVPAALDALACAMHTPGLHPRTAGCAGMRLASAACTRAQQQ